MELLKKPKLAHICQLFFARLYLKGTTICTYNVRSRKQKQSIWLLQNSPWLRIGESVSHELLTCVISIVDKIVRLLCSYDTGYAHHTLKANRTSCTQSVRSKLGLLTLKNRRRFLRFQLVYKIINDYGCPKQLKGYLPWRSSLHGRGLRDNTTLPLPKANTTVGQINFLICWSEGLERFTKIDKINYNLFTIQSSLI